MSQSENWREAALVAALRAESCGSGFDGLLCALREHDSSASTAAMWLNRRSLETWLTANATDVRSLVEGRNVYYDDDRDAQACPYIGWLGFEWQGSELEIAFAPSEYDQGRSICIARDGALLDRFCKTIIEQMLRPDGRCLRYTQGWESAPDLDREIASVKWDDIVLAPATLDAVRVAAENFFAHRAAFDRLGFAWRRGVLLVGPPGTGKTMICKAMAASLPDLPFLYVRDMRETRDKEAIKEIFRRARALAPCMLIFEDLDGLIGDHSRTVFLNELDGFESNAGIFVVASTNHPSKIDLALLRRPSRFDRIVHIGLPGAEERRRYASLVLSRPSFASHLAPDFDTETLARSLSDISDGFTLAYIKEAIVSAALNQAQEGLETLDERFAASALAQMEELRVQRKKLKDPDALAAMNIGNENVGFRR